MILVRELVRAIFVGLANLLHFRRMPAAFYVKSQEMLENIFLIYHENNDRAVLAKHGFYMFNGDDMVIYSHKQAQSVRTDLTSSRWTRIADIEEDVRNLMGYSRYSHYLSFVEYMRDYLDDQTITEDSYVTLFECARLNGLLVKTVMETLEFRASLWTPAMCIE